MYMICLDSSTDPNPVADGGIKADASLNRRKALDRYGVTALQVCNSGPVVVNCIQTLINTVFFNKEMPSSIKLEIIYPI